MSTTTDQTPRPSQDRRTAATRRCPRCAAAAPTASSLGVAGGLGRYAGIDPLIFRILFVVLAVFGGSGLLLYALGWLLVPEDGEDRVRGPAAVRRPHERVEAVHRRRRRRRARPRPGR